MQSFAESHLRLIDELDARQDDVLSQIDELNSRIERLLAESLNQRDGAPTVAFSQQAGDDRRAEAA